MKRFSSLLLSLLLLLCALAFAAPLRAAESKPDMTGQVKNAKDEPVSNAVVMIIAAGPRQGQSPLCPYSYPDCGKKAVTDANGDFRIASLDPTMDFCIRVMASGYGPFVNSKLIPEAGPVRVKLDVSDFSKIPAERHVQARIIGPDGNPVAGAAVDIEGEQRGDTTYWGGISVDGMAIADANGKFHIVGPKPFTVIHAVIEAPGLAKRWARLEPGKMCFLRMNTGVEVKGRLLFKGQPLANVKLGIATVERECGLYLNGFQSTTGKDGRFVFKNIPRTTKFQVFSIMDSAKTTGASLRLEFDTGNDGQPISLGELQAQPTHRITGNIVLADGKSLPAGTRLLIDRHQAWDFTLAPVDAEGRFDVDGVPEEQVSISLYLDGYRFSEKNSSLDSNHRGLIGRVVGDIPHLTILLEPGKPVGHEEIERPSYEEQKKREEMPLRGIQ